MGLLTNIFSISSVLWSIVLAYLLYWIINNNHNAKFNLHYFYHIFIWGISLLVTFIPLINSTYGPPDGHGWCWIISTDNSPDWAEELWFWLSYYLWIWLSIIIIIILYLASFFTIYYNKLKTSEQTLKNFYSTLKSISGYQVIIIICWGLCCISDFMEYYSDTPISNIFDSITGYAGVSVGFLQTIYFWIYNTNCRNMWLDLYKVNFNIYKFYDLRKNYSSVSKITIRHYQNSNVSSINSN
jgi:hypothetical protein